MTNKQVFLNGSVIEHYPIDYNPFTGKEESNGGVENLVIFNHKVYSVITDFTGSVADPDGPPDIISDDPDEFIKQIFSFDDPEEVAMAEANEQAQRDDDEMAMLYYWEQSQRENEW
jgi:hypothetical protein